MLNALERLADGYESDIRHLKAEITLKEGQLRDFDTRLGATFAHEEYASQLADLRDQLKLGLSENPPEGLTPVAELASKIEVLRSSNMVEAAPERTVRKAVRAERPVTARIKERIGEQVAEADVGQAASPQDTPAPAEVVKLDDESDGTPGGIVVPMPPKPKAGHAQQVTLRRKPQQLSLF